MTATTSKTMTTHKKDPLVRIVRRESMPLWKSVMVRVIAVVASLLVSGVIIYLLTGASPIKVYGSMLQGAFGNSPANYSQKTWITVRDTMMLLCIAVGLAPAFKMKFWNIGAEGQVLVGGIATAACMIYLKNLPPVLLFICMVGASLLAGAIWGLLPAVFKAKWDTNETLFTLMMNYVALQLTSFCVAKWENPIGSNKVGIINQGAANQQGWFPAIFGQDYMLNVIIVMALTVGMFFYLKYSKQGYEIAVIGDSQNTARYAGISVKKVIIRTMLISGAICGLAGFITVSGSAHTISTSTAGGKGFTAIIVAWLAKFNTFTMILIALLITVLDKGAIQVATEFNISKDMSNMITGIILFFIIGSEFFINYKLIFRKKEKEVA
ncbi:ABC transporter permease [Ruminococcus sp.]|uniref:ABC transporter permease n=1 Tax=Ruminococcus sp. TaxID=41978 RepID=UPI002873CA8C|nr:ABC transporter permease [Ruminococcus sp.]